MLFYIQPSRRQGIVLYRIIRHYMYTFSKLREGEGEGSGAGRERHTQGETERKTHHSPVNLFYRCSVTQHGVLLGISDGRKPEKHKQGQQGKQEKSTRKKKKKKKRQEKEALCWLGLTTSNNPFTMTPQ